MDLKGGTQHFFKVYLGIHLETLSKNHEKYRLGMLINGAVSNLVRYVTNTNVETGPFGSIGNSSDL
jgi:hypothetical protein